MGAFSWHSCSVVGGINHYMAAMTWVTGDDRGFHCLFALVEPQCEPLLQVWSKDLGQNSLQSWRFLRNVPLTFGRLLTSRDQRWDLQLLSMTSVLVFLQTVWLFKTLVCRTPLTANASAQRCSGYEMSWTRLNGSGYSPQLVVYGQ